MDIARPTYLDAIKRKKENELPDVKSFSIINLHYMEWFYELSRC